MAFENLPPTVPIVRLGDKMLALHDREFNGKKSVALTEVRAILDESLVLEGFSPIFGGVRASASSWTDLRAFASNVLAALDARGKPPAGKQGKI